MSKTISTILVPTDFGPASQGAVEYAVALAHEIDARIQLLHVFDDRSASAPWTDDYAPMLSEWRQRCRDAAEGQLAAVAASLTNISANPRVVDGNPAATIVAIAREQGADLIVMGTHGRRGLSHVLLGSVAERVVRMARCPVLTVRQPPPIEVPDEDRALVYITK